MRNEELYHLLEATAEEPQPIPYCDSCEHSVLMTADMLFCDYHKKCIFRPWGCPQYKPLKTTSNGK